MDRSDERIVRKISWIAVMVSAAVAIVVPSIYFVVHYQYMAGSMRGEVEFSTFLTNQIVSSNPDMWKFEQHKLNIVLSRPSADGRHIHRRIVDAKGNVIAESGPKPVKPVMTHFRNLFDADQRIGRVEVSHSMKMFYRNVGLAAFLGVGLGGMVFLFFRVLPVRSLQRTWQELSRSQALFQSVMEDNTDAMAITDSDKKFIRWNKSAERLYGYSEEEILGKSFQILIPEGYDDDFRIGGSVHESGNNISFDTYRRRKDGTIFPVNISLSAVWGEKGEIAAVCAIHKDLTERLRQEEELRRSKESAEAASQAKSEFLANMSHEIRTPMNGVIGMTRLLLDTDLTDQQRQFADSARISAESLLTVINDILDFSKIEAGQMVIEPIPFDLYQIVGEVMEIFAGLVRDKGLEISVDCGQDIPRTLIGDPGRIRQVLNNLVNNAVKFTEDGFVRIQVKMTEKTDDIAHIRISVEDSGIGIEEEKLPHLFEKFTQADASTTRRFGGTGLGLSISKQLIELMGGKIGISSRLGEGSTFWFTLPLPIGNEEFFGSCEYTGLFSQEDGLPEGLSILLVEDNEINQLVAREILEVMGCSVNIAVNGREALEMISGHSHNAIFMDCHMPEMDGFETAAEIRFREKDSSSHVPIIAMTASVMADDRERCFNAGMDDFISKPVQPEEMKDCLLRWVGTKKS